MEKRSILFALIVLVFCFSATSKQKNEKPNVIVILSDDMGYSDIGCYGGEINTPNLDKLAVNGIRFSQYYNAARCCPTRASILTGIYPHQAGMGYMARQLGDTPSYQGYIKWGTKTIADYFKEVGYTTIQVGKWHVGHPENKTMPCERGFDMAWATHKRIHYWNEEWCYENGEIRNLNSEEKGYLTDTQGKKAIEFVEKACQKDQPFMMYLAFDAAHWPLHAKPEDIDKYRGKFMAGWDELQKERIRRLDSIGLVPYVSPDLISDDAVPAWETIAPGDKYEGYHAVSSGRHDQDDWDLQMAVYAAQIDCMDQNIGKLISKLKELDEYENTIIIFLQDNGGCAEGIGKDDPNAPGGPDSYQAYGLPWANLSNTPFKMYKHFLHEGGISTPFIFHWPNGINKDQNGKIVKESFGHLIDVIPTCLDAAGVDVNEMKNLEGQSLLSVLQGKADNSNRTIYWEHEGNRAIRKGDWKLVSRYSDDYKYFEHWGWNKEPRKKEWELYNIREDRWELNDLSDEKPELLNAMIEEYQVWYNNVGAVPRKEVIKGSNQKF